MTFEKEVITRLTKIEAGQKFTHDTVATYMEKTDTLAVQMGRAEEAVDTLKASELQQWKRINDQGNPRKVATVMSGAVMFIGGIIVFVGNWIRIGIQTGKWTME